MTQLVTQTVRETLETVPELNEKVFLSTIPGDEKPPFAVFSVDSVVTYPKHNNPDFVVAVDFTVTTAASSARSIQALSEKVHEAFRKRSGRVQLLNFMIEEMEVAEGGYWEAIAQYRVRRGF